MPERCLGKSQHVAYAKKICGASRGYDGYFARKEGGRFCKEWARGAGGQGMSHRKLPLKGGSLDMVEACLDKLEAEQLLCQNTPPSHINPFPGMGAVAVIEKVQSWQKDALANKALQRPPSTSRWYSFRLAPRRRSRRQRRACLHSAPRDWCALGIKFDEGFPLVNRGAACPCGPGHREVYCTKMDPSLVPLSCLSDDNLGFRPFNWPHRTISGISHNPRNRDPCQ